MSEIKNGAAVIGSMKLHRFFLLRMSRSVQQWASLNYYTKAMQSWLAHMNNITACTLGGTAAFFLLATRENRTVERGGLALTYALLVPYFFTFLCGFILEMRTSIAALERLLEYTALPQVSDHRREEWIVSGGW